MSKEAALAFHERLKTDSALRCKVNEHGSSTNENIAEIARAEGYDCTADELGAAAMSASPSDELGEDELENVSGGTEIAPKKMTVKIREASMTGFKKG